MSAATVLAFVASGIFLLRLLPQPVRLWRTGVAAGVSPVAAANAVTSATAWLVYGLDRRLVAVWAVSLAALVPGIWQIVLLRREYTRTDVASGAAVAAAFLLAGAAGLLSVALALGVVVTSGPQVWRAIRESDLCGIAPATWVVAIGDALSWGLYGVVIGDHALEGYGIVLLTSAVIVLGRVLWTRQAREETNLSRQWSEQK